MPRLTNLDDIMFPVEEHPVFVSMSTKSGERRLPVPELMMCCHESGKLYRN